MQEGVVPETRVGVLQTQDASIAAIWQTEHRGDTGEGVSGAPISFPVCVLHRLTADMSAGGEQSSAGQLWLCLVFA